MDTPIRKLSTKSESTTVENPPGIFRTAITYDKDTMLCHFTMTKGAEIPLHNHLAAQIGYVVSGKVKFKKESGEEFIASTGTSYVFSSNEKHGANVLETAEVIEVFAPMRPEYSEEEVTKNKK